MALFKDTKVAEVLSPGPLGINWNLPFTRDPYDWEIFIVGNLMEDLQLVFIDCDEGDSCVWSPSVDGLFSYKSFNMMISDSLSAQSTPVSNIWNSAAPLRVKAFSWIVLGRQYTLDVLQRRPFKPLTSSICPLCMMDEEFDNHIFIYCAYSSKI